MLSNPQKALLKQAQRQAGLNEADYREALQLITGCTTSTDPRISDSQLDTLLAYFEAIYWRGVDAGRLQAPCKGNEVFQKRGFWAAKNTRQENSRDRFTYSTLTVAIESLEAQLAEMGFGPGYFAAIRRRVIHGAANTRALHAYRAALARTLQSKMKGRIEQPF